MAAIPSPIPPRADWPLLVDTVLLDMDGTLLDRHFDDYFWHQYLPEHFSLKHEISIKEARCRLREEYRRQEGTLAWTDLDYWSERLGLDIPELKMRIEQLIAVHPYVPDFLKYCRKIGKRVCLVTNAHTKTLAIKMERTALAGHFDRIICAEEIGLAKEEAEFWQRLARRLDYRPLRTMLADDTERVLDVAGRAGIGFLIHVARPSSRGPVIPSVRHPSIVYFKELMPAG